ncbi:MAG: hypothetical protein AVDCRST_MAG72-2162 [uncultured Nocardioidaceae bacterium]|uniref:Uncharacterized protein n=1 Tax=uncultured Nocardioidaceae bacterium TaxID=253824 RepID=A0A6J4MLP2_9ACTN|nr:MAG: hypothetical protein AVDCRST_MAG72-2162 [uncultured Nocardioidaceae bacterium]
MSGAEAAASGDAFTAALTQELGKKTGVCWLRYGDPGHVPVDHAAWHVWLDGSLYVVSGGDEQHLPGIEDVERLEVVMRSRENGGRLLTWVGKASVVRPGDEAWEPATTALVAGRLNLDDLSTAVAGWAEHSVVTQITPVGELTEGPGSLGDDAGLAAPPPTPAITRGPLPKILGRRSRRRPRLS